MTAPTFSPALTNILRTLGDHLPDEIAAVRQQIAEAEASLLDRNAYLVCLLSVARAAGLAGEEATC